VLRLCWPAITTSEPKCRAFELWSETQRCRPAPARRATREVVTVEAATAQINYDSHTVAGVVTRETVEDIPLNGRNMLQLATLEPGVTSTPASVGVFNSQFTLSVLGTASRTYVTVDGGSIVDNVEGNTAMNLSNEVVQEFQTAQVNFDLGTGITSTGAINIVTRSGSNDFHGSGYFGNNIRAKIP